jgi:hypothetical protein
MGAGALIGGLAMMGGSIYSAEKASGSAPYFEPARDARHWIDAFIQQGGSLYDIERQLRPAYSGLERTGAQDFLFGNAPSKTTKWILRKDPDGGFVWNRMKVKTPGTPGLMQLLKRAQPQMENLYFDSGRRYQDYAAGSMGRGMAIGELLDPEGAAMRDRLIGSANEGLELGGQLDPAVRREVQQAARAGQSARGMGLGPSDLHEELMQMGSAAEARKTQRQNFALGVSERMPDYRSMAIGEFLKPSPAAGLGMGVVGSAFGLNSGVGPKLGMDPWRSPGVAATPGNEALGAAAGGLANLGGQMIGSYIRNSGQRQQARTDRAYDDFLYEHGFN